MEPDERDPEAHNEEDLSTGRSGTVEEQARQYTSKNCQLQDNRADPRAPQEEVKNKKDYLTHATKCSAQKK